MSEEVLLAVSTFPDADKARQIARQLVSENLVACANIVDGVESVYQWQNKIEEERETLVFFKTTAGRYSAFQDRLKALHPFEVPEIVCLNIVNGLPAYLRWVAENTQRP